MAVLAVPLPYRAVGHGSRAVLTGQRSVIAVGWVAAGAELL